MTRYKLGRRISALALLLGWILLILALILLLAGLFRIQQGAVGGTLVTGSYGLGFILLGELSNAVFDMADKLLGERPADTDLDRRP